MSKRLRKILTEELEGKKFVYVSKYGGEIFSKVSSVSVGYTISMDKESGRKFKVGLSKRTQKVKLEETDKKPIEVENTWSGQKYKIEVVTPNGNYYNLNEIYFIK